MLVDEVESKPTPAQSDKEAGTMILGEFDVPRTWMPAGEISLVTAAVFLLVALIAWLR